MTDLAVLILTFNEEQHIERCINSVRAISKNIFIVDSYSTDNTVQLAEKLGAKVYLNIWKNYSVQYQWGLDNCPIDTEWVLRMDADEYLLPALSEEIERSLPNIDDKISGIYVRRRLYFQERWIKHGGYYPTWLLRLWRYKDGFIEQKWMDEHIKLRAGTTIQFKNDLVDDNLNDLTWWTEKHNAYSKREVIDLLNTLHHFCKYNEVQANIWGTQEERKRYLKIKYAKLPLFVRPFIYFLWRYFLKLGFLDGKQGLIWHVLQGFWYRFLVDAKIYELEELARKYDTSIAEIIENHFGITLTLGYTPEIDCQRTVIH